MQTCGWQLLHTSNSGKMALLCWPTISQNRARLVAVVCYWDLHIQRSCKNTFLVVERIVFSWTVHWSWGANILQGRKNLNSAPVFRPESKQDCLPPSFWKPAIICISANRTHIRVCVCMCLYVVGWDILVCSVNRAMEEGVARWRQQSGHASMLVATGFSVVSWRHLSRKQGGKRTVRRI